VPANVAGGSVSSMTDETAGPDQTAYDDFRRLHRGSRPLLLPNAWDFASAAALVADGHRAIGTTSLGVALSAGLPDAAGVAREVTVRLVETLARLPCLLTVDIEGGFADDADGVAAVVAELASFGAVGVNIEDGRGDRLCAARDQAERIAAVKARTPAVFVNARTDTYWLRGTADDPLTEALRRAAAYVDAGADGVFVPGATDVGDVRALASEVGVPLNVLVTPGRTLDQLGDLGVARVSTGSLLFRAALGTTVGVAAAVRGGAAEVGAGAPSYGAVQALVGG
jgi:2-methylisocitrate lyase-like PEP mutase family enzyme